MCLKGFIPFFKLLRKWYLFRLQCSVVQFKHKSKVSMPNIIRWSSSNESYWLKGERDEAVLADYTPYAQRLADCEESAPLLSGKGKGKSRAEL